MQMGQKLDRKEFTSAKLRIGSDAGAHQELSPRHRHDSDHREREHHRAAGARPARPGRHRDEGGEGGQPQYRQDGADAAVARIAAFERAWRWRGASSRRLTMRASAWRRHGGWGPRVPAAPSRTA